MASIVSTIPSNGATEVFTGSNIAVTFDSNIDPNSLNPATFVIYDQNTNIIQGTIDYSAATMTATFYPQNPLMIRSTYTVVIEGGTGIGVRTVPDVWGNIGYLPSNYQFSFITNDGRFFLPPAIPLPSGVNPNIMYPSGVTYDTPFIVGHTDPDNREGMIDPSGLNLDVSGNPNIIICFNKPVDVASLNGAGQVCYTKPATVIGQDVLQDPFVGVQDYTPSGQWSAVQWQARFTFYNNTMLYPNEEITVTIPSTVTATDQTTLGADYQFYFTTKYDPYYVGVQQVRLEIGNLIADIPDDTIARLIHSNSILANWFSSGRPNVITPFLSSRVLLTGITTVRPAFVVDPVKGAPEYVKRYVLYKTELDLLKARYQQFLDGLLLGGGPGASKMLDDLRISEGIGSLYAATVGPLIQDLEGSGQYDPAQPIKGQGLVAYWLGYITGNNRWRSAIRVNWGWLDPRTPPRRGAFMGRLGAAGPFLMPGAQFSGPGDRQGITTPMVGVPQMPIGGARF